MLPILPSLAIVSALSLAPPAAAERQSATVTLEAGESVVVTLDDGGRPHETARGAAPRLSRFEAAAVWNLTRGVYGEAVGPESARIVAGEDGVPVAPAIAPGAVRIKLVSLGPDSTLLVLENGYDRGLSYRATIAAPGEAVATDVCQVMPRRFSLEHWPYRITRLELSGFRLVPWIEGQDPICE
ncbi:MAG TPA: hypothetical protein VF693_10465 [Allosphingosinicella sp.]|jgi:hypothetical protein